VRHIHFLHREVPAARIPDYNAFLHAVQTDQAQFFTLNRTATTPATPPAPQPTRATPTSRP
jgi:hypothetical protein